MANAKTVAMPHMQNAIKKIATKKIVANKKTGDFSPAFFIISIQQPPLLHNNHLDR